MTYFDNSDSNNFLSTKYPVKLSINGQVFKNINEYKKISGYRKSYIEYTHTHTQQAEVAPLPNHEVWEQRFSVT